MENSIELKTRNIEVLGSYKDFHGNFMQMPDCDGVCPKVETKVKDFLLQVESGRPILLNDAYDIEEIKWMCCRLRTSERFGRDNRLYLRYSSWKEFVYQLQEIDWEEVVATGKVVFLFSKAQVEEFYPSAENSAPLHAPLPLVIEEVNEVIKTIARSTSGSDFLVMIFDNHPSLLTVGFHALKSFSMIYRVFCEGKTAGDAVRQMRIALGTYEVEIIGDNFFDMMKYKPGISIQTFYDNLLNYLATDQVYTMKDWLKAVFLASNETIGRNFHQRIAPAIFFDVHGGIQPFVKKMGSSAYQLKLEIDALMDSFEYVRYIGIARHPLGRMGSGMSYGMKHAAKDGFDPIGSLGDLALNANYAVYFEQNDNRYERTRMVRFEDLKLYPKETLQKCCDFLQLPWSDTLLSTTVNGEDSGVVDGTAGFDVTPVYKEHLDVFTRLDYYRLELLNGSDYCVWGYKHHYYDGQPHSREELRHLFAIPFRLENVRMEGRPDWPDEEKIKEWHEYAYHKACHVMEHGQDPHLDKDGNPMKLVECLFPDLKEGQKLYE